MKYAAKDPMARSVILALITAIPLAIGLSEATEESTISVRIRVAGQDSPIQVVGLKKPEKRSHSPLVHLRNTSSKQTARIWIEAIIAGRDGRVARTNSNSPNLFWPEERAIMPGGDRWAHETVLQSAHLLIAGKDLHSNCLRVTVLVLSVEFADGSSWHRGQNQEGVSWTYPSQSDAEDPCKDSTANESDVARIEGVGFSAASNLDADPEQNELQSYGFSCRLIGKGEKLVAMCPF